MPLLVCLLLSIGSAVGYELWKGTPAPRRYLLQLDGHPTGQGFELDWNPSTRAVADARSGVLTISDGFSQDRIDLQPAVVRQGKFSYATSRPDVMFRLEVLGNRHEEAAGSLRIVKVAAANPSPPPPAHPKEGERSRMAQDAEPAVATPPEILHEVEPTIPHGIRARINGRVVIPVKVWVSTSGRVIGAAAQGIDRTNSVYEYLADHAVKAAHDWRFSPAKSRDGRRTEASKIIYFTFTAG